MNDPHQMLTPKAVAELLGVHPKTVHLWLRTGKMQGIKISYRAWRIPRSALEEFIEKNRNIPPRSLSRDEVPLGNSSSTSILETMDEVPRTKMKEYIQDIMGEQGADTERPDT